MTSRVTLSGLPSFLDDILFSILDHISYSEDFPIIVISRQLSSPSIEKDVAMHLKCLEWNRKVQWEEIKSKHWELVHLYNTKKLYWFSIVGSSEDLFKPYQVWKLVLSYWGGNRMLLSFLSARMVQIYIQFEL